LLFLDQLGDFGSARVPRACFCWQIINFLNELSGIFIATTFLAPPPNQYNCRRRLRLEWQCLIYQVQELGRIQVATQSVYLPPMLGGY